MGDAVGHRDVVGNHFDIRQRLAVMLDGVDRPLMLVQQRHRTNQRQVFHMVAAESGAVMQKGQPLGERVHHHQRPDQPLGILVEFADVVA